METTLQSHGDAAVELLDLLFEELFELRPLGFQRGGQEAILNRKHLSVDVDVLHLQIITPAGKSDLLSITSEVFKKPCDWLLMTVFWSWTHLLKGVEATGFAQTYQIFQDGLLQLLLRERGCSNNTTSSCARDTVVLHPLTAFLHSSW